MTKCQNEGVCWQLVILKQQSACDKSAENLRNMNWNNKKRQISMKKTFHDILILIKKSLAMWNGRLWKELKHESFANPRENQAI